ncbi:MAG TPA: EAL domain-containing protein [Xanthobacteraceae bacterium]
MLGKARIKRDLSAVAALASRLATVAFAKSIPLGRLWWAAILLLGISAGAVGWTIWQLRVDAIRAAIADSGNIAAVLADQMSRSLQSIDAVLSDLKSSSKSLDTDGPEAVRAAFDRGSFYRSLIQFRDRLPQVFNIAIADATGQVVVSTAAWPAPNVNVADRDYFNDARTRVDGGLSTSIPIDNRINGTRTIVFARRLEGPSGNFIGIVYASVNSKYFEDIYESTQSVHSLIFTLVRQDGTILFRHPSAVDLVGQRLSAAPVWLDAITRGVDGYRILGRSDGKVRYVSVRPVPGYALFVNTSVTESLALAGWARRSAIIGLGSTALLLCSLVLLIGFTRQVRRLSESEASLTQKSQQLDAALNNMPQGLAMFDGEQRLVVCNKHYAEMYDLPSDHMRPGTPLRAILEARVARGCSPDRPDYVAGSLQRAALNQSYVIIDELRDGRKFSISHQLMSNGGWVAIHQDITAQKRVEAELAHMARYDPLTGLANRAVFLEEMNEALRQGERFSVLMLDLDQFKVVNDSLGHATGDALLRAVAERFHAIMHDVDHVARFGGDEFALLQTVESDQKDRNDQKDSAIALAKRILETVTQPYDVGGRKVVIGVSIGITLAPDDGRDADVLIRNADLALYKAKSEGRNRYRFFETAMEVEGRQRRELENDMRKALARHEFELHYQTIVDVEDGECRGAEALVRWRHPERGLIPPDQFISLAEESGLIIPLGEWILRQACADAARWASPLKVAINLSPVQFKQSDLLDIFRSALQDSGLAPQRLELEITETVLIENNEENLAVLHQLKNLGASIVLDDFGIGYSSMRYLQIFPIDKIKIDKSFIQSMPSHSDSVAIVCAIAGLARNLDIETTAEGVETREQLALLRGAGCQLAQGYLFSRPLPASRLSFERPEIARNAARVA